MKRGMFVPNASPESSAIPGMTISTLGAGIGSMRVLRVASYVIHTRVIIQQPHSCACVHSLFCHDLLGRHRRITRWGAPSRGRLCRRNRSHPEETGGIHRPHERWLCMRLRSSTNQAPCGDGWRRITRG